MRRRLGGQDIVFHADVGAYAIGDSMPSVILPAFLAFPKEAAIIGRLIAGYGELEFEFTQCAGRALGDQETAARALYRLRGEDSRMQVADALMRPSYAKHGLGDAYNTALGSMRFCKSIRNQYAHCHWLPTKAGLFFTDFEKPSKTAEGDLMLTFNHVDELLLVRQETYFLQTFEWLSYLLHEHRRRVEKLGHPWRTSRHASKSPTMGSQ